RFCPTQQIVITAGQDEAVCRWNLRTGELIEPVLRHKGPVLGMDITADGRFLVTGSNDNTARWWDVATGTPVGPPLQHFGGVAAIALSARGEIDVTGSYDHTSRAWSVPTGALGDVDTINRRLSVLLGMELDQTGNAHVLTVHEWLSRRDSLPTNPAE